MHFNDAFFVALGFVLFVLFLAYLGVHTIIANALDKRGREVQSELDEARRLREEAEAVLADYQKRAADAEQEAAAIIAAARAEAEAMAQMASERMAEFVARRTRQAEDKIAVAETQAANEVRAAAADAAVAAAETVLRAQVRGELADDLISRGIDNLKSRLH